MYEFKFPDVGEGIHEGKIVKWLVKEGELVKEDQNVAEIETDKAIVELPSPKSGTILKILAKEKETIKVGQTLVAIGEKGEQAGKELPAKEHTAEITAGAIDGKSAEMSAVQNYDSGILASPYVRKLAQELKVDLSKIKGTGKEGLITEQDVKSFAKFGATAKAEEKEAKKTVVRKTKITFDRYGRVLRVHFAGIRKIISERVLESAGKTASVTLFDEANITKLAEIRDKKKQEALQKGFPLTYLPFIAKAVELSLKENPYLNSSIDDENDEIILKQYYNIGFAVDITEGILVPVVKNSDKKGIFELAKEMKILSDLCRSRKINIEELKGSTFTITNLGSIGGIFFTPIINYPETAIIGIGKIRKQQAFKNNELETASILPISLTFDHRLIDGARAARFMNDLISHLENPEESFEGKY
ncbi:MAG TPA: dihydrolipoamide acetyltransferase family protein [Candidatus Nanoarchaeia archaeon]|nr:dihydrolipoamide acetyltransferase family protein [Candidatus Nanoarchaeia archaeon]